ncbi:2C-methyl-D-erythritol 2,4-cyclodiphosphate synthase [Gammaproteobacteria bacterium]|nr:2C-methyl-D-erythritol 2,4-cyclodiphosphate synthase [Gammaproteobacteria bacterium]
MKYKIGSGFDVHAFKEGDFLILCGVKIPFNKSFLAHSDGDVAIHALIDALLGSLCLGDIGELFPDTDPAFKNIDSRILLKKVYAQILEKGWNIGNIDLTIMAQAPALSPYKLEMRKNIAQDLNIELDQINIKATTTESLGFVGRKEGIAATATVLISQMALL